MHVEHELFGLLLVETEQLLEHPRHVRHQVYRVIPDDGDPWTIALRDLLDLGRLCGDHLWRGHALHRATAMGHRSPTHRRDVTPRVRVSKVTPPARRQGHAPGARAGHRLMIVTNLSAG